MKKIALLLTLSLFISCFSGFSFAKETLTVRIDGKIIEFDVQPQIIDGRTMVPLRTIFDELGAVIKWDGNTKTVTAARDGTTVVLQIGNKIMKKNSESKTLDVGPMIIGGRTLVPARAIAESFDAIVDYDRYTKTVFISRKSDMEAPKVAKTVAGYAQAEIYFEEYEKCTYEMYSTAFKDGSLEYLGENELSKGGVLKFDAPWYHTYYKIRKVVKVYNREYDAYEKRYSELTDILTIEVMPAVTVSNFSYYTKGATGMQIFFDVKNRSKKTIDELIVKFTILDENKNEVLNIKTGEGFSATIEGPIDSGASLWKYKCDTFYCSNTKLVNTVYITRVSLDIVYADGTHEEIFTQFYD